jgi:hypothetical protein
MLLRYAMMVGVAAAAAWAAVNLGARDSNMILVDAGQGIPNGNLSFWILGMIAGLMVLSLARVVVFGLPSTMDNWVRGNKSWLFVGGGGSLIYALLYLM